MAAQFKIEEIAFCQIVAVTTTHASKLNGIIIFYIQLKIHVKLQMQTSVNFITFNNDSAE